MPTGSTAGWRPQLSGRRRAPTRRQHRLHLALRHETAPRHLALFRPTSSIPSASAVDLAQTPPRIGKPVLRETESTTSDCRRHGRAACPVDRSDRAHGPHHLGHRPGFGADEHRRDPPIDAQGGPSWATVAGCCPRGCRPFRGCVSGCDASPSAAVDPCWSTTPTPLDRHLIHREWPPPGSDRQLLDVAAGLLCQRLPTDRSPWLA